MMELVFLCLSLLVHQSVTQGSETDMMMVDTTTEVSLDSVLPIFIREPEAMYYVTGKKSAVITCRTLGAEHLTFMCNRRRVPEAFNDTYVAIDPETNRKILERSITILRDDVENALAADGYNCTCIAWYDDVVQQGWAQLDKTGQIEVAFLRKSFQQGPMSKKVTEGAAVEIPCLAPKGNPDPSIFWNKNGARLEDMEDENVMVASTGSLVFNMFQPEDEGNYTCVAENAAGTRNSDSAEITISGYQVGVIRRLDMMLENQKEHLSLMRQLLSSIRGPVSKDLEDVLPSPLTSQADLEQLSTRLGHDSEFKKKMTCYLASLGGATVGDCARRIMRRLGTNELWSGYSLKGRKGKKALREMPVLRVIFKACLSSCKQTTVAEVEEVVRDFLKQAPHKRGGLKFKNP